MNKYQHKKTLETVFGKIDSFSVFEREKGFVPIVKAISFGLGEWEINELKGAMDILSSSWKRLVDYHSGSLTKMFSGIYRQFKIDYKISEELFIPYIYSICIISRPPEKIAIEKMSLKLLRMWRNETGNINPNVIRYSPVKIENHCNLQEEKTFLENGIFNFDTNLLSEENLAKVYAAFQNRRAYSSYGILKS